MGINDKKEEEKGFVVRDRRFTAQKEGTEEPKSQKEGGRAEETKREDAPKQEALLPEINFTNFLLSISTSALIQLGEIPDPATNQSTLQVPLAKQTIDLIGMLQEKTRGNLTSDEGKLMEHILYDLRMRFVKATR